ncbi:MAG TPA: DUF4136 domain-containing protein [Flavitalea sp.]|nr:DUF4136 domain-containing protein [Flavitalea sp.]
MKKYFSLLSLATITALILSGCGTASHVEVAQGINFNNYKTFGWANDNGMKKSGRADNDIIDNNIKNSVSTQLEKKRWQETDQKPDVLLDYNVTVHKGVKRESEPVYSYPYTGYFYSPWRHRMAYYYNPGFFRGYHSYNVPFKEGTLTVNMIDANNNKLIWQGCATGDITSRSITSKEAQTDVKSIFRKLNLPEE